MSETIKYLADGSRVCLVETTQRGYLVEQLYEYDNENRSEFSDCDRPFIVEQVFDTAPTKVYDDKIMALQDRIARLNQAWIALDMETHDLASKTKETEAKLFKYKQLEHLFDFIDGKITHYVDEGYSGVEIIEFSKATCGSCNDYDRVKALKLLTLFGDSKGNLEWRLNQYKDGSGCSTTVTPVTSYEEAVKVVKEILERKMEKGPSKEVINLADKYLIPIPEEYRKAVHDLELAGLQANVEKLKKQLVDAEKTLKDNADKTL